MNANIQCLTEACKEAGVPIRPLDEHGNCVELLIPRVSKHAPNDARTLLPKKHHFLHSVVPLNLHSWASIARDKGFTYETLKDAVNLPRTKSFMDPAVPEEYQAYVKQASQAEIVADMLSSFSLPFIVKRNSGAMGKNVFLCKTEAEVSAAVASVFRKDVPGYDYIVLAQEYVNVAREYRVLVLDGQIEVVYEKSKEGATFVGNLSPLHWDGAKAVLISDEATISAIAAFIAPLFEALPIRWTGLDVALDTEGKWQLFEINSAPQVKYLVRDNGKEIMKRVYRKILALLSEEASS